MRAAVTAIGMIILVACGLDTTTTQPTEGSSETTAPSDTTEAREILGVSVGAPSSSLVGLGEPIQSQERDGVIARRWTAADGNSLSVSVSDGRVIYVEHDWNGAVASPAKFQDMRFGVTNLRELRSLFGERLAAFGNVPCIAINDRIAFVRGTEGSGVVTGFITSIPRAELPTRAVALGQVDNRLTLEAVILTTPQYARQLWGEPRYDGGFDYTPSAAFMPMCG